jgi:endo-1,4-beta-mannosidase
MPPTRKPWPTRSILYLVAVLALNMLMGAVFSVHADDPPPLPTCTDTEIEAALTALPSYQPANNTDFARLQDGQFWIGEAPFYVRGVNYFPVYYPWRRYLTETGLARVDTEFALLNQAGLNTLRTFLWYEPMFICEGNGAVPRADVFQRLDGIIHAAANHDLRIILTLHDTPNFDDYPLYTNPAHVQEQTAFIVERYRDEATILAWDIRNEGDIDYGSRDGEDQALFPRQQVLDWVAASTDQVYSLDPNHLLTAGWMRDAAATAPYVDFVSFHHWWDADDLRQRIAGLHEATDKPVLLEEFGYSTLPMSEEEQAQNIQAIIDAAEDENVLGWLIWTAFDFPLDSTCLPPACPDQENPQHHYGIWHADYTPKPAAQSIIERFGK